MKDEQDTQTADLVDAITQPTGFRSTPPMVGWWAVRRVEHKDKPYTSRRWWNGTDWSIPVPLDSDKAPDIDPTMLEPSTWRPGAFEWTGLAEPALSYPYALHATNNEEAFSMNEEALATQANLLRLAWGPEAKERLVRERTDPDVVQQDEYLQAISERALKAEQPQRRRVFD